MELLIILCLFSIVSSFGFYSLISIVKELKSEITSLKIIVPRNKESTDELANVLTECQDQALNRIEMIEKLLNGFCMMKLPTIEEQDKLYQKIKRDATDFKKCLNKQESNLDKFTKELDKRVRNTCNHIAKIGDAVDRIKQVTVDDFDEYRDMVEKEIRQNNDGVFRRLEDIARDFHVLLTKVKDGSFKEMKILSEDEYLKLKKLK